MEEVQLWTFEQTGYNQVHGAGGVLRDKGWGNCPILRHSQRSLEDCGDKKFPWKKANVTAIFRKAKRDLGRYRLVSLTWVPGKVMEQIHLETISKHHKVKEVTGSSQQGLMKGKSWLTYLASFYKKMAALMRRVDVVYLDFSKALNTISRS